MQINEMPLILEIPFLPRSATIATFIPSPTYAWASVHFENATAVMNLDGHNFVIDGKTEKRRLANLLFLSSSHVSYETLCRIFPYLPEYYISGKMLLKAFVTGEIKREVKAGNLFDRQIFTELHVLEIRFETTTEKLQETKEAEISANKILSNLKAFLKK